MSGPPIRDGWVSVDRGRIVEVGYKGLTPLSGSGQWGQTPVDNRCILPGLVNAHTHLELSWMQGRVPPGGAMPEWAERLIDIRRRRRPG